MSNSKTKKFSFTLKLAVVFAVLAVIFLILSVVSANYSVDRTVDAIDAIGAVEYSEASKEKIDLALSYYAALDSNLGLSEKITNAHKLNEAKIEYVRLGIKQAYLADKNGEAEETVQQYVAQARQSFDEYCSAEDPTRISNYKDLIALEEKYSADTSTPEDSSPSDKTEDEEIELC